MQARPDHWSDLTRPPLDERGLRRALHVGEPAAWCRDLSVVEATDSTNADLAERVRGAGTHADAPTGGASVLVAEHQRAGRGRMGRAWVAPPRSALTLSVLVRPLAPPARWPWLPLLTGVAVVEALRATTGLEALLKWPNDVLVDERKVAGVLLERTVTASGPVAVLGIGINVTASRDELPVRTATSLLLEGARTTDRQTVLVALLRTLAALCTAWEAGSAEGADGLHASYVRRCSTLGRQVRVGLPDGSALTGRADAVDSGGRLVLATAEGSRTLGAGDVVHVRPDTSPGF